MIQKLFKHQTKLKKMFRGNSGKTPFLLLLAFLIISGCSTESEQERPNILWIVSEDNSPFIGAYGDSLAVTPNIDRLADRGILYENAFATTPVCAPARFTIITGLYGNSMGTEHMRSTYPVPDFVKFFPRYLREAGYYTTNNVKKDYNTVDQPEAWDQSSETAHYKNREEGQPFFHVRNFTRTHESQLHQPIDTLIHHPDSIRVPPYHPNTETVRRDWAKYYDLITEMDLLVGGVLEELEESGEAENTIVFYYSDHGGVLPRSKRYMFDSGLHVPMIVSIPPKFQHLRPDSIESGKTDRLVSFVDLAPTVLSLAGIEPPEWMHGKAFMGPYEQEEREYVYAYRGRMDERYDLSRAVRSKDFLYVHNYMPHRIYGQHLSYLWRSRTMQQWEELYTSDNLNRNQEKFFRMKPVEELYNVSVDPHNVNNLAAEDDYRHLLEYMRNEKQSWMFTYRDIGFIQESRIDSLLTGAVSEPNRSLYEAVREEEIPIFEIMSAAEMASRKGLTDENHLSSFLNHNDSSVRYWAVRTLISNHELAQNFARELSELAEDSSPGVRISTAETLFSLGDESGATDILTEVLDYDDFRVKLMALNVLEALNLSINNLPVELGEKIISINEETESGSFGTDYYLHRASATLLN